MTEPTRNNGQTAALQISEFTASFRPRIIAITCGYYRTSSPVTALPLIMRWISDVPSKIVKLVEVRAVSAGRCPVNSRSVSTNSARLSAAAYRAVQRVSLCAGCFGGCPGCHPGQPPPGGRPRKVPLRYRRPPADRAGSRRSRARMSRLGADRLALRPRGRSVEFGHRHCDGVGDVPSKVHDAPTVVAGV